MPAHRQEQTQDKTAKTAPAHRLSVAALIIEARLLLQLCLKPVCCFTTDFLSLSVAAVATEASLLLH